MLNLEKKSEAMVEVDHEASPRMSRMRESMVMFPRLGVLICGIEGIHRGLCGEAESLVVLIEVRMRMQLVV